MRSDFTRTCRHLPPVCDSEQAALRVLGYTQATWDNLSGREQQPWSAIKSWYALTANEKVAADVLGYNQPMWDNRSGSERQPFSFYKYWDELTACGDGEEGLHVLVTVCLNVLSMLCCAWRSISVLVRVCRDLWRCQR